MMRFLDAATEYTTATHKRTVEREIKDPQIDGICGGWLDEDGMVKPEFRDAVARQKAKHRAVMMPIGEVIQLAQRRL